MSIKITTKKIKVNKVDTKMKSVEMKIGWRVKGTNVETVVKSFKTVLDQHGITQM
jgi:hypothetical protein